MSTERQIQAARENGRKSIQYDLSPRCAGEDKNTRSGKRNSARNSIHHGLHAQTLLLDGELPEFFNQLVNSLHEEFQPQTASEIATVESMAWARWRQKRLWSFEQAALNQEIRNRHSAFPGAPPERNEACARAADAFSTLADNSKALHLMHRCETSCDRQFSRALRRLSELRGGVPRPPKIEISERTPEVIENKPPAPATEPDFQPEPEPLPDPLPTVGADPAPQSGHLQLQPDQRPDQPENAMPLAELRQCPVSASPDPGDQSAIHDSDSYAVLDRDVSDRDSDQSANGRFGGPESRYNRSSIYAPDLPAEGSSDREAESGRLGRESRESRQP